MPDHRPIGILDSGVGGLSTMREISVLLPHEDILYVADTAHCPYGAREEVEICRLATASAEYLLARGAKLIVVACNTASVASLQPLRAAFPAVPFVGIVPAVKPAASSSPAKRIAILATNATVQSQIFDDLVQKFASGVDVFRQACEGWVELVESGDLDSALARATVASSVRPALERGADTIVLGCTHFPFLRPLIEEIVGAGVRIIDTGVPVARQVRRVLEEHDLLTPARERGRYTYFTSGDPAAVAPVVARLIADPAPHVRRMEQDETLVPHERPAARGEA